MRRSYMLRQCATLALQFWRQGKGDYFQGIMFMAELSTPSVCLGKILIQVSVPAGTAGPAHRTCRMPPGSHFTCCALHFSFPFFHPMGNVYVALHPFSACSLFTPAGRFSLGQRRHKAHSWVKQCSVSRSCSTQHPPTHPPTLLRQLCLF